MNDQEIVQCVAGYRQHDLFTYFDGCLTAREVDAFEEHLLICVSCQEQLLVLDWMVKVMATRRDYLFSSQLPDNALQTAVHVTTHPSVGRRLRDS